MVVHTLCVPPQKAGKGYGRRMIRFAIQKAKESGCRTVHLDTWTGNKPAAALYKKEGFRFAGAAHILLQGLIPEMQAFFELKLEKSE